MKQFLGSKKQYKLVLLAFLCLVFSPFFFIDAETVEELQHKISEKNQDIQKIEQQIAQYQNELNSISKQKNTLSSLIKQLDLTRKKLSADISLTENKITKTNLKIESLGDEIYKKEDSISNDSKAIGNDIQRMYDFEQENSFVELILSSDSIADVWKDLDQRATLREALLAKIQNLKITKGELEDTRDETIDAKNELIDLKNELADQKKIVDQNKAEKDKVLKDTKNNESNYQKLLKAENDRKALLEQEVEDYESRLKFILDPNALPGAGVLSWPLEKVYITQLFGKTVDAKRLYASGSHSGVDFRASVGTPVMAMADGVVTGFGDTDITCNGASFGKWVFIEYNNGLSSTYGHLSLIKAYEGQKVSRGDVVAYSGATGHVTGPHLHVTVYAGHAASVQTLPSKACPGKTLTQPIAAKNAYLDPMYYLPPYNQ